MKLWQFISNGDPEVGTIGKVMEYSKSDRLLYKLYVL